MHERILHSIQKKVRDGLFVMTVHADEEMDDDALSLDDIIHPILNGITERQADRITKGWKYRIEGPASNGDEIGVLAKIGATGKVVIITVFRQ